MNKLGIIIVTHNSEFVICKCLEYLESQVFSLTQVIIVDSGSRDISFIKNIADSSSLPVTLITSQSNVGFAKANNMGVDALEKNIETVIFLNPDCFLPANFLSKLVNLNINKSSVGAITGKLLGFDIEQNQPTNLIDSTGIFQTWYGKWFDRGQGEPDSILYDYPIPQSIPAICGALLVCQKKIINLLVVEDGFFFNEHFFMYKEDIDLSLRIRRKGWKLLYFSDLSAFHCRGWQKKRFVMSLEARLASAQNELYIALTKNYRGCLYSFLKYVYVQIIERAIDKIKKNQYKS